VLSVLFVVVVLVVLFVVVVLLFVVVVLFVLCVLFGVREAPVYIYIYITVPLWGT
jgi:hypothetical protein